MDETLAEWVRWFEGHAESAQFSALSSGVFRLEESLLIFSGIANEMKSRKSGHPEADSFALGPVLV
jgi:hypothetical protein